MLVLTLVLSILGTPKVEAVNDGSKKLEIYFKYEGEEKLTRELLDDKVDPEFHDIGFEM